MTLGELTIAWDIKQQNKAKQKPDELLYEAEMHPVSTVTINRHGITVLLPNRFDDVNLQRLEWRIYRRCGFVAQQKFRFSWLFDFVLNVFRSYYQS